VTEYSFLDRMLHRAALQVGPIAELSFDLDQKSVKTDPADVAAGKHVFVSGLARAGTTILMRRFYGTGGYCSLTYRNMPFVLAPNLWKKLSKVSERNVEAAERAHGDRILVDVDSPESLDEVFWRVFDGDSYITKTHLGPHAPDAETLQKFVAYINAILNAGGEGAARYLSKNNNNILRLASIRKAFPNAAILIPFRDPVAHAGSLLRMHVNFVDSQADDAFVKSYMSWLAHHEFGLDHRPFRFDAVGAERLAAYKPGQLDYWLEVWRQTYGWLETSAPEDAVFVCYEDLCQDPSVWSRLAAVAGVENAVSDEEPFVLSQAKTDGDVAPALMDEVRAIYGRLVDRGRIGLEQSTAA